MLGATAGNLNPNYGIEEWSMIHLKMMKTETRIINDKLIIASVPFNTDT